MIQTTEKTTLSPDVLQEIHASIENQLVTRIWQKDAKVWKDDKHVQEAIEGRLGWLDVPDWCLERKDDIIKFAEQVRADGITSVVVLGMGGSSLCVEVIRDTLGVKAGYPKLLTLDSTHPDQVLAVERDCDLAKTLFIVASKSGTTLEPECYFEYFWHKLLALGLDSRVQFCVITDPGTPLEKMGDDRKFRGVFANPADIGGRYSALSYFGIVPAALIGVDIEDFLSRASSEAGLSKSEDERNTSLVLGAFMGQGWQDGRDKLTIITAPELRSFGYWAEQLIAESTGKEGKGILPIEGETERARAEQEEHRIYVHLTTGENSMSEADRKKPYHLELHLADIMDLGEQFFRWEFATAVAGSIIGINPFDEPNVAESKKKTNEVLNSLSNDSSTSPLLSKPETLRGGEGAVGSFAQLGDLGSFLSSNVKETGYIAIMAYLHRNEASIAALATLREKLSLQYHVPVTVGFGPRFLHSTGQLHKGGPPTGTFIQFVDTPKEDAAIPGKPYTFATLIRAQAMGDAEVLRTHGRPLICFDLGSDAIGKINAIV